MALLTVNNIWINASIDAFHEGSTKPHLLRIAMEKAREYEQTGNTKLIPEFMQLVEGGDTLFPMGFGVNFCRKTARYLSRFRAHYPIFEEDELRIIEFHKNEITDATQSNIKRLLFMLYTSTTVQNLDDLTNEVWSAWMSTMKDENTQFKDYLGFNSHDKRALKCLGTFMDAHYPSDTGYANAVKIRRLSNIGKTGKTRDLLDNPPPELTNWIEIFENFKSIKSMRSSKMPNSAFRKFVSWLENYPVRLFSDPLMFLSAFRLSPSYVGHLKSLYGEQWATVTRSEASFIIRMVDHFIEENMVTIEDGERTDMGYPIVSHKEREEIVRDDGFSSSHRVQASANPMPLKWVQEVQKILTDDDWAWPKSLDLYWITIDVDGVSTRVWNPVIPYLVYGMTELPWRKIQFKSLDSGEGDSEVYDPRNDCWVPNLAAASGYWDRDQKSRRKARGILNRQGESFAFYVNTNKTADRKNRHDETSGYYVPWKYLPMINLFTNLREWQQNYNPLARPSRYSEVTAVFDGADPPAQKVINSIPDRFYLFRDIQGADNKVSPPTDNRIYTFWRLLMDELEKRLRASGENATIILSRNKFGGPSVAQFQMHGLRVSGLTAFAEAGVPIEILSKLVAGHASILMTIYYLKFEAAHVTDILTEARLKVEAIAAKDFGRHLTNKSVQDAMKVAVANEVYTLEGITTGKISTDQFFDTGLGVCPYNGTRCGDGIALSGGRTTAVPGGAKNCLHCRHFITGEPWLMALALNQQRLAANVTDFMFKIRCLENDLAKAENERARIVKKSGTAAVPPSLARAIAQVEQELERHSLDLDEVLKAMNRAHIIIEMIKMIQKKPESKTVPSLVGDASADPGEFREGTRFELIDTVLQASRIYPILHDDRFEMERRSYIDAIMYHNGLTPLSMMNLSSEQKIRAADAASKWLMTKVGATDTELLRKGAQTLRQLGYNSDELFEMIYIAQESYPRLKADQSKE